MAEQRCPTAQRASNMIVFCKYSWRVPALALGVLIAFTFFWGFYLLDDFVEESELEDFSLAHLLFQDTAAPDPQHLYEFIPAAVVGVGGGRVNASVVASGAIVGSAGYVLTTAHALAGLKEVYVYVRTPTGTRRYEAQMVKTMPGHDLVLLKMLTQERFLFLPLADTQATNAGEVVFAFGTGPQGNLIVKQGTVIAQNAALTAEAEQITHLLKTTAVYTWAQSGGPLVNAAGELVGISVPVENPAGVVDGFAVPSHVILAHFQDVVDFKRGLGRQGAPSGPGSRAQVGQAPGGPSAPANRLGSAAWWANARAQVAGGPPAPLGSNAAWGNGSPVQDAAGSGSSGTSAGMVDTDHSPGIRLGGFLIWDVLGLFVLALVVGLTGGMMTMGGGVLQVAGMMLFFGYGMYLIRPVAYLTNVFVYGASALRNNRSGLVMWENVRALAPWAVAGVLVGYGVGSAIGDQVVYYLLGIFALLMAAKGLHEIFVDNAEQVLAREARHASAPASAEDFIDGLFEAKAEQNQAKGKTPKGLAKGAMFGMPMGLVSGVLGISGGVLEVPLQRYLGGVALRNAIANSSVLVFWASAAGAIVAFAHGISSGLLDWQAPVALAFIMVPGAYLGGMLGARLMAILPTTALKTFYTLIMLAIAARILLGG